jgi:hypothetical protein
MQIKKGAYQNSVMQHSDIERKVLDNAQGVSQSVELRKVANLCDRTTYYTVTNLDLATSICF